MVKGSYNEATVAGGCRLPLPAVQLALPHWTDFNTHSVVQYFCWGQNWKTALDKYTIQALITFKQLLITYLLITEWKISIISFNK